MWIWSNARNKQTVLISVIGLKLSFVVLGLEMPDGGTET